MKKVIAVIAGMFLLYAGYNVYVYIQLHSTLSNVQSELSTYHTPNQEIADGLVLSEYYEAYTEFFTDESMSQIYTTELGKLKIQEFIDSAEDQRDRLIRKMNETTQYSIPFNWVKQDILDIQKELFQQKLDDRKILTDLKLESFYTAQSYCLGEKTIKELTQNVPEIRKDHIKLVIQNAEENLCDEISYR